MPGVEKDADLLFVGRTEDRKKGIGTMLEALSLLPEHITLKIVDGRIPDDGLVPRLIAALRHREPGDHPAPRCSACPSWSSSTPRRGSPLVPSFFEGFGFPASEAMACGLPVVANAAGALPEVVGTDGERRPLVPERDARAMADAIADVLSEPGKAEPWGAPPARASRTSSSGATPRRA